MQRARANSSCTRPVGIMMRRRSTRSGSAKNYLRSPVSPVRERSGALKLQRQYEPIADAAKRCGRNANRAMQSGRYAAGFPWDWSRMCSEKYART